MSDLRLAERHPLADLARPGRHGQPLGEPGLVIQVRAGIEIVQIAAREGAELTLRKNFREQWGVELPAGPKAAAGGEVVFLGTGPAEWLALAPGRDDGLARRLMAATSGVASVVDQSHGRVVLRVSGPRVRDVLEKGCPIDLHPRAFAPGNVAITLVSQVNIAVVQVDLSPAYDLIVPSTYAGSAWAWLTHSAAAFGYLVDGFGAAGA